MVWQQNYDPFNNIILSCLVASIPIIIMMVLLGFWHMRAHYAAGIGLIAALLISIFVFGMPAKVAGLAAGYGAAFGLLPIGWIVLNIIFLHQLTEEDGSFKVLQNSLSNITDDRRLQLLLIAFAFGAFFEGAAGFGTPVAVTAALLIGLGFRPLAASGLSLIANTAPVAYGALGTPVIALAAVTDLDLLQLSGMIGRQLPFFSFLVPFWLIWARHLRDRLVLCRHPVPGLQLPRPLARRRHRRHRVDGLAGAVPEGLEAEEGVDLDEPQGP